MTAEELFRAVVHALSTAPQITKTKMFGSEGLKVGSKVFAVLVKGKLVVKLPAQRVARLVASGVGVRFDPGMGRVMKEWVALEPSTESEWLKLAKEARDFVASAL